METPPGLASARDLQLMVNLERQLRFHHLLLRLDVVLVLSGSAKQVMLLKLTYDGLVIEC